MEWYVWPIIIILFLFAFRKGIWEFVSEWYAGYSARKKHEAHMARLHCGDTKFNQKEYLKQLQAQKKAQMKKNREKQEDVKRD